MPIPQGEPDRDEFTHEGFRCLVLRGPFQALNGYIAIPVGHPWHGLHYDHVEKFWRTHVQNELRQLAALAKKAKPVTIGGTK